jgi:hypothetical protein
MTDLPLVYVVCQAEYEANGPVAVFTTPEFAEQHAANLRGGFSDYLVDAMPLLDHVPARAELHLRQGLLRRDGTVEAEQSWTVEQWDYDLPTEPVVTLHAGRDDATRIHVAAASPEAAVAAFWGAVESLQALGVSAG